MCKQERSSIPRGRDTDGPEKILKDHLNAALNVTQQFQTRGQTTSDTFTLLHIIISLS